MTSTKIICNALGDGDHRSISDLINPKISLGKNAVFNSMALSEPFTLRYSYLSKINLGGLPLVGCSIPLVASSGNFDYSSLPLARLKPSRGLGILLLTRQKKAKALVAKMGLLHDMGSSIISLFDWEYSYIMTRPLIFDRWQVSLSAPSYSVS